MAAARNTFFRYFFRIHQCWLFYPQHCSVFCVHKGPGACMGQKIALKHSTLFISARSKHSDAPDSDVKEALAISESDVDVQLFDETNKLVRIMKKCEAQDIAKASNFRLVLIGPDTKPHPSYQLMTGSRLFEEQMKLRHARKLVGVAKKEEKLLRLKSNISDHDLDIKMKKIREILASKTDLKITLMIAGNTEEEESRKIQNRFLKKISKEVEDLASVMSATSSANSFSFLLRVKVQD